MPITTAILVLAVIVIVAIVLLRPRIEASARARAGRMPRVGAGRLALATLLIGILFFWLLRFALVTSTADQFTVLVAPFREPDGSVSQTGRSVARRIAELLPEATGGRVSAQAIETPPASEAEALALLERAGSDALVWGDVTPGALPDAEAIVPVLAYRPSGSFAPHAWEGYDERFAMPLFFRLSGSPINGAVILPRLLGALASYGLNQPDLALADLQDLITLYPSLDATLPNALIGNIHWARGEHAQAAEAYSRALATAATDGAQPQLALLANNLGAILQDAGDLRSRDAFNQAITALNAAGGDLAELRFNLGLEAQRAGDLRGAAASFEQAYRLRLADATGGPPSTRLLLALSRSYRAIGLVSGGTGEGVSDAQAALRAAEDRIAGDIDAVTPDLREHQTRRLRAALLAERALVGLAQLTEGADPLLWELEAATELDGGALGRIKGNLDEAIELTEARARAWSTQAAAQDAADRRVAGQIAASQSRAAEQALREYQRWQAAVAIEIGETERPAEGIAAIWSGALRESSMLGQAQRTLENLAKVEPRDVDIQILLGSALLQRGEPQAAGARFSTAADLAPQRPEPTYGLALVALADDRARAEQLLLRSVELNAAYFPARYRLAELAEESGNWAAAVAYRRQIAAQRPSKAATLALAHALRLSGRDGYAEAEQLLLPLAQADEIEALTELSRIYRDYGDRRSTRAMLEQAQSLAPRDAQVAYDLGQLDLEEGQTSSAERQFRNALSANPRHVPSLLALAEMSANRPEEAADYYRRALDAGANDPARLKEIGATLLSLGQHELALTAFERSARLRADDAEVQRGIAQANLQLGRLDAAQQAARRALDLRGGAYPEAQADMGDIALQRGNLDEAIAQYGAALAQSPRLTQAHIGLGRANAGKDQWAVALGHFRNAVAAEPDSAEAQFWLGEALVRQNDARGAVAAYEAALERRPSYPEARFGLAQAQLALEQPGDAVANLEEALRLRPDYAEALVLRGKLYEQAGNTRRALDAYGAAVAADRDLPEPHYRRALLLIQENRLREARGDLQAALASRPIFPEASYWLGRIDFAEGRYPEALKWFEQAVAQAGGTYAEARFYQGLAEEQLGLREAAIASYQATLEDETAAAWAGEAQAALTRLATR